nr:MAK10-like protein [Tanacetum cinerariifolium]
MVEYDIVFAESYMTDVGLTLKVPHHDVDLWLQIQIFYDHVSFPLKSKVDHTTGGKLRNKSTKESWKIIEDLALDDNESWNDSRDFAKPLREITLPHDVPKTSDQRLLELEDQISYLLKRSKTTPKTSSPQPPQAHANVVSSNQRMQSFTKPLKKNSFTFQERAYPKL